MAYYVAERVTVDGCLTPVLPEDLPWSILAEFSDQSPWVIVRYDLPEDTSLPDSLRPVTPELDALLWSSERYPPALALARSQMWRRHRDLERNGQPVGGEAFERELAAILRKSLDDQADAPYLLARSKDGSCYVQEGAYYWLVAFDREENCVWWVSGDYFAYQDDSDAFAVTREQLERLPSPRHQTRD